MQRKLPAVSSFAGLPAFGNDSDDSDGEEGPPSTASSLMAAEARGQGSSESAQGQNAGDRSASLCPSAFQPYIAAKGRAQVLPLSSISQALALLNLLQGRVQVTALVEGTHGLWRACCGLWHHARVESGCPVSGARGQQGQLQRLGPGSLSAG